MEYTITCAGIPIATTSIPELTGLAHALIHPLPAYAAVREHAIRAGAALGPRRRLWSTLDADFADSFARTWSAGRLALTDAVGGELSVASVMLAESAAGPTAGPRVIVDARPAMARVEAVLHDTRGSGGGRSRPAA